MHENNVSQGILKAFKGTLTQWSLVRAIETSLWFATGSHDGAAHQCRDSISPVKIMSEHIGIFKLFIERMNEYKLYFQNIKRQCIKEEPREYSNKVVAH